MEPEYAELDRLVVHHVQYKCMEYRMALNQLQYYVNSRAVRAGYVLHRALVLSRQGLVDSRLFYNGAVLWAICNTVMSFIFLMTFLVQQLHCVFESLNISASVPRKSLLAVYVINECH